MFPPEVFLRNNNWIESRMQSKRWSKRVGFPIPIHLEPRNYSVYHLIYRWPERVRVGTWDNIYCVLFKNVEKYLKICNNLASCRVNRENRMKFMQQAHEYNLLHFWLWTTIISDELRALHNDMQIETTAKLFKNDIKYSFWRRQSTLRQKVIQETRP